MSMKRARFRNPKFLKSLNTNTTYSSGSQTKKVELSIGVQLGAKVSGQLYFVRCKETTPQEIKGTSSSESSLTNIISQDIKKGHKHDSESSSLSSVDGKSKT